INTSASVDHECTIGNAAHVGPGVRLAGRVCVGDGAWIDIGATVLNEIRIGAGAVIGAGSLVTKDVPDGMVAYGVPARLVHSVRPQVWKETVPTTRTPTGAVSGRARTTRQILDYLQALHWKEKRSSGSA